MFDQFKQLKQLKEIQDKLSQEKVEVEKEGVRLVMNGKMEVEEISLNPEMSAEKQGKIVKECFNDAIKKIQMLAAQKMFHL